MVPETKNTCEQVFGKRLKELRKEHGYTIEQFADMVGISKSTLGYYENDKRMPDIEILARIANVLNVSADYLIGRTNTTARKGKLKTVCDFTGLSDQAAEYLSELVENRDYAKLSVINHLFKELCEDYSFYCHEKNGGEEAASSILGALFFYFEKCCYSENADYLPVISKIKRSGKRFYPRLRSITVLSYGKSRPNGAKSRHRCERLRKQTALLFSFRSEPSRSCAHG